MHCQSLPQEDIPKLTLEKKSTKISESTIQNDFVICMLK